MTALAETGPHNWENYTDYWRDSDAEWLQSRSILRVSDLSNATTGLPSVTTPGMGQVVYVKDVSALQKDMLYMYASTGTWIQYPPFPKFLFASTDSIANVTLGHHTGNPAGAVQSLSLSQTGVAVLSDLVVRANVLKVTATDVQIKTGSNTASLTTDNTNLVSNTIIKAPGFVTTGPITATGQTLAVGPITATSLTASAAISGATVGATGAITAGTTVNAATGTAGGFRADKAAYLGDTNGAVIRRTDWAGGNSQLSVYAGTIRMDGGSTVIANQPDVYNNVGIRWFNGNPGTHYGWLGPVVYSASDPGGPNGTIWVIP